jgi:hypothetical protein
MKHPHQAASRGAQPATPAKSVPPAAGPAAQDVGRETWIREAAYYRYLARDAEVGHELEDWLQAEAELIESGGADDAEH